MFHFRDWKRVSEFSDEEQGGPERGRVCVLKAQDEMSMDLAWTLHPPDHCCEDLWKHVTGALKPPDTSVASFTFGPGSQVKHCRDISGLCSCISSFYFQVPISLNICTLRIPDTWPKSPVAPGTGSSNSSHKKVPHYWCVCVCVSHTCEPKGWQGAWFADVDRCRVMTPISMYGSLIMREV